MIVMRPGAPHILSIQVSGQMKLPQRHGRLHALSTAEPLLIDPPH